MIEKILIWLFHESAMYSISNFYRHSFGSRRIRKHTQVWNTQTHRCGSFLITWQKNQWLLHWNGISVVLFMCQILYIYIYTYRFTVVAHKARVEFHTVTFWCRRFLLINNMFWNGSGKNANAYFYAHRWCCVSKRAYTIHLVLNVLSHHHHRNRFIETHLIRSIMIIYSAI